MASDLGMTANAPVLLISTARRFASRPASPWLALFSGDNDNTTHDGVCSALEWDCRAVHITAASNVVAIILFMVGKTGQTTGVIRDFQEEKVTIIYAAM